jgi:hypothetical protein
MGFLKGKTMIKPAEYKKFGAYKETSFPATGQQFLPERNGTILDCILDAELAKAFGVDKFMAARQGVAAGDYYQVYGRVNGGWYFVFAFGGMQFPSCCGLYLMNEVSLAGPATKDKSIKSDLYRLLYNKISAAAKTLGYSKIITTEIHSDPESETEWKAFEACKWTVLDKFTNRRTNHEVGIFIKEL